MSYNVPMTDALTKAKEAAGSAMALAQRLGITPQAIYQWRKVPADKAIAVERLTGVSAMICGRIFSAPPPSSGGHRDLTPRSAQ